MQGLLGAGSVQGAAHRQRAARAISLKSFARGDVKKKKKRPRVCELGVPSKKPHQAVLAEGMMLAERKRDSHSHAQRTTQKMI